MVLWITLAGGVAFMLMAAVIARLYRRHRLDQLQLKTLTALGRQLDAVLQSSADAITLEALDGTVTCWSPGAQALFGYTADDIRTSGLQCLTPLTLLQEEATVLAQLGQGSTSLNTTRLDKDGLSVPVTITFTPVRDAQGQQSGVCRVMRSTRAQKIADELIRSVSFNDNLTGLPNWRLLRDRLWRAQLNSGRQKSFFAVLYVDLDQFKAINDAHGHDAGDQLLVEVSARLMAAIRQNDTVARLGGDEFIVLLEDLGTQEAYALTHANAVADKIMDLLEQRDCLLGRDIRVTCTASVGIQVMQGGNGNVDQIIKNADAAMARVKKGRALVTQGVFVGRG